ncbi:MAG: MFS transporter [Rickettsiaceae bacterium H1]|nr:MFS transporter [Rickettsiaceae bacterium H1]
MGELKKVVLSTVICNSLIWYDYALYGSLIGIIGKLFFPSENSFISLIEAFGVFAVGFLMRPIGAILFGHVGDIHSRKYALFFAIISMTIPMLFIAFLPTYDSIGIAAPILLILVRLIQGLALGGEAGNAAFLIEYSPDHRRGFICSFEVLSAVIGSIISTIVITVCKTIVPQQVFYDWGWRIPFVFGIIIGIIGALLRYFTEESPAYEKAKKSNKKNNTYPLKQIIQNHKKNFFTAIGIDSVEEASLYVFLIFFYFMINESYLNNHYVALSHLFSMLALAAVTLFFAAISDKYGRKKIMLTTFIVLFFLSYPIFWLLTQQSLILIIIGQLILVTIIGGALGPVSAAALELFPISVRYSGFAISRNISAALFGGMAPTICAFLIHITGEKTAASLYLMFVALFGIISFLFFKDKYNQPIH